MSKQSTSRSAAAPPASASAGARVRAAAAAVNARVVRDGASLEDALAATGGLPERDLALLKALTFGACRWHHRLEWQAAQLLSRPLARRDAQLAALLRVGLFQLQSMRVPDHAAVSATVEAAQLIGAPHAKGLVNAVLRRFLREREKLDTAMTSDREALYSHPAWMIDAIREDWPDDWEAILEANNAAPPMWLRVNRKRTTPEQYVAALAEAGIAAEASTLGPEAVLLPEARPMSQLPGYAEGEVSIQDASAQLAAPLMNLGPGQRVLDACAAPGGKTAHMLELAPELKEMWAVDRDPGRLETVQAALKRLGLAARLVRADATRTADWWDGEPFDRILLDAPCSALGVIRRHPDIKLLRTPADLERVTALQSELLAALWPLLRPGGRLVYATCTLLRRENREQIERFMRATPDARLSQEQPPFQIKPGEADRDGFYYACVDKQETPPLARVSVPQQ